MTKKYEAYCMTCLGGGKSLGVYTSQRKAASSAQGHSNAYGCSVTVITK